MPFKNFAHPVTSGLGALGDGFHLLESKPGGLALDFIRANLFDRAKMQVLPADLPEEDNDLNDKLEVALAPPVALGNRGGIVTLLNAEGLKVHGVSYTAEEGRREAWTVVF